MINRKAMITFFLVLIFSVNLFAGGIIKIKTIQEDGEETIGNIYIQDGKMRMEDNEDGNKTIIIFDAEKNVVIIMDPSEESYIELDENFGKQINKQMEDMLKNLPEEQREAMKAMMNQQMGKKPKQSKPEYKKVGNENFKGYNCEVYEMVQSDNIVEKTWVTDWNDMKLKDEYVKIFKGMEKFFSKMADSMGDFGEMMGNELDTEMFEKGFPIKTIQYEDGKPVSTEIVEEVSEKDLPSSLFEVPENMTKKDPYGDM